MSVTVNVNGLSLVHQGSNGLAIASVPDVCKTPTPSGPVPIPYPNIALSADLAKGTKKVKTGGNMIAVSGSEFSRSTGDEPGTAGGVVSGTFMKEATWLTYSFDVKIENKNACRLTDKMLLNHGNTLCAAGELQAFLVNTGDPVLDVLCQIFCEVRERGHKHKGKGRFNYSSEAKKLGKSSAAQKAFRKAAGEGVEVACEKGMLAAVKKGALKGTGRVVVENADAIERRVLKAALKKAGGEAIEGGAKKLGKKAAKKIIAKFIPVVNILSTAYDVYELVSLGIDISKQVSSFMKAYDTFRIRPDVAVTMPDGTMSIYDYKFDYPDGGADSMKWDQRELYKSKTGEKPRVVDRDKCQGCKKK